MLLDLQHSVNLKLAMGLLVSWQQIRVLLAFEQSQCPSYDSVARWMAYVKLEAEKEMPS